MKLKMVDDHEEMIHELKVLQVCMYSICVYICIYMYVLYLCIYMYV